MQLIEVSLTGLRSAAITLQAPDTAMRIILFPMLHLGSAAYYQSVTTHLAGCDLIVGEGITGTSVTAWALSRMAHCVRLLTQAGRKTSQAWPAPERSRASGLLAHQWQG